MQWGKIFPETEMALSKHLCLARSWEIQAGKYLGLEHTVLTGCTCQLSGGICSSCDDSLEC